MILNLQHHLFIKLKILYDEACLNKVSMKFESYPRYKMSDFKEIATNNNIDLLIKVSNVRKGRVAKPKDMLQVLWERDLIDENNVK